MVWFWVCKKVAVLGEWAELEGRILGLNLVEVEDLGTFWDGIVKELGWKATNSRALGYGHNLVKLAKVGV